MIFSVQTAQPTQSTQYLNAQRTQQTPLQDQSVYLLGVDFSDLPNAFGSKKEKEDYLEKIYDQIYFRNQDYKKAKKLYDKATSSLGKMGPAIAMAMAKEDIRLLKEKAAKGEKIPVVDFHLPGQKRNQIESSSIRKENREISLSEVQINRQEEDVTTGTLKLTLLENWNVSIINSFLKLCPSARPTIMSYLV